MQDRRTPLDPRHLAHKEALGGGRACRLGGLRGRRTVAPAVQQLSLPTSEDYEDASDALWRDAAPALERIWWKLKEIVDWDQSVERTDSEEDSARNLEITLADVGELFVFVDETKLVVEQMQDHVDKIEAAMRRLRFVRRETVIERGTDG